MENNNLKPKSFTVLKRGYNFFKNNGGNDFSFEQIRYELRIDTKKTELILNTLLYLNCIKKFKNKNLNWRFTFK